MNVERYRRKPPKSDRRVLLALLSGASNLWGMPLGRASTTGTQVYVSLARLQRVGWVEVEREERVAEDAVRRYYRLTPVGRERAAEVLSLDIPTVTSASS